MPVKNYALGSLNPVVYFENSRGVIALPPSTDYARAVKEVMYKRGFELREAGTLPEIDGLQKRMVLQEYQQQQRRLEVEEQLGSKIRGSIRDRLYNRMTSSGCSDYEKEFIRNYLQVREDKRYKHQQRFLADQCYFENREFDASSQHIQSVVDRVPEGRDLECRRCHKAQKKIGDLCFMCANTVEV